jgi:hypothetical protein
MMHKLSGGFKLVRGILNPNTMTAMSLSLATGFAIKDYTRDIDEDMCVGFVKKDYESDLNYFDRWKRWSSEGEALEEIHQNAYDGNLSYGEMIMERNR